MRATKVDQAIFLRALVEAFKASGARVMEASRVFRFLHEDGTVTVISRNDPRLSVHFEIEGEAWKDLELREKLRDAARLRFAEVLHRVTSNLFRIQESAGEGELAEDRELNSHLQHTPVWKRPQTQ